MPSQNNLLLLPIFTFFYVNYTPSQPLDSTSAIQLQSSIALEIVNDEQYWKYDYHPDRMSFELVSHTTKNKDTDWPDQLPIILKQRDLKNGTQRRLATTLKVDWSAGIKWAEKSPDEKYVLVGYEDPAHSLRRTIKIFETTTGRCLKAVEYEKEVWIEDFVWSPDSRYLVIIEERERWSKSIVGILGIMSGHPIPLVSYTISVLNVSSGEIKKLPLAKDIKYGVARISIPK